MSILSLGGDRVFTDERAARTQYPYVAHESEFLYPGLLVPVWAVELREACKNARLDAFGRELLRHVKRLFPSHDDDSPRAVARYKQALESVAAALTVLRLALDAAAQEGPGTKETRLTLAEKVLAVLFMEGRHLGPEARAKLLATVTPETR